MLIGLNELKDSCTELLTAATPAYQPNDRESSTSEALFGRLTDRGIELCQEQPSREQRKVAQQENFPYCRFLLTHNLGTNGGDHVIVVGTNPSGARSFQGDTCQDVNFPQSDKTAKRLFRWTLEGYLNNRNNQIKRLSIINLFPIIETKLSTANHILKSCDMNTIIQINKACIDALELRASSQTHIVVAYGRLKNRYWRELERSFIEAITHQSLWQLDFGKKLNYPPHPLHRSSGSHFEGVKPYEIGGVSN